MTSNTRHILKSICDAARPIEGITTKGRAADITLAIYEKERMKTEDLIFVLYSDVIDELVTTINMRLKPRKLFQRVLNVLRRQKTRNSTRLAQHLMWYWHICSIVSTLYKSADVCIEYLPFEV